MPEDQDREHGRSWLARAAGWIRIRVSWSVSAEEGGRRAPGIVAQRDRIEKAAPDHHAVRSRTDESTAYSVVRKRNIWSCDYPDHRFRSAQCRHALAAMSLVGAEVEAPNGHAGGSGAAAPEESLAEAWMTPVPAGKREAAAVSPVDETPHRCERCNSREMEPHGWRYSESEPVHGYRCRTCGKRFVFQLGPERMRNPAWAIVDALDRTSRDSRFEATDFLKRRGIPVHPATVGRWVQKFVKMCVPYLDGPKALVGDRWHADKVWMRITGKRMCLFLTMDDKTRFCMSFELGEKKDGHNARALLGNAKERAGKVPLDFVIDGCLPIPMHMRRNMPRMAPGGPTARTRATYA